MWSTILFIVWPQEELQLACAWETTVGAAAAFIVNTEGFCVRGENQRLWCKAQRASSLYPFPLFLSLSLLRLEFISLPPFSSQSGKTSPGNSLDYPIIFLLQHGWGEWGYTTEISSRFFFFFSRLHHNGLTVSCSQICRPWTAWWFCFIGDSMPYNLSS